MNGIFLKPICVLGLHAATLLTMMQFACKSSQPAQQRESVSVLTIEEGFDGEFLVTLGEGLSRSKVAAPAVKEKEAQEAARIDSIRKFSSYCSEQAHPCLNKDLITQEIIAMMRLSKKNGETIKTVCQDYSGGQRSCKVYRKYSVKGFRAICEKNLLGNLANCA
ncbi:MAG: hypothetical protein J0L53_07540 [Spirochaetes bacterium]|nr:hypothetical protein [Spirochaetota bacterium]